MKAASRCGWRNWSARAGCWPEARTPKTPEHLDDVLVNGRLLARGENPEAVLEALSKGLTAKFLHGPQQALHHAQGDERARLATLLPQLFRTRR